MYTSIIDIALKSASIPFQQYTNFNVYLEKDNVLYKMFSCQYKKLRERKAVYLHGVFVFDKVQVYSILK